MELPPNEENNQLIDEQLLLREIRLGYPEPGEQASPQVSRQFEDLINPHIDGMRAAAYSRAPNSYDAEDAVSHVLANLWARVPTLEITNLRAYLNSAVVKTIISQHRHNFRVITSPEPPEQNTSCTVPTSTLQQMVDTAEQSLRRSPKYGDSCHITFQAMIHEVRPKEQPNPQAARARYYRVREMLRPVFENEGYL